MNKKFLVLVGTFLVNGCQLSGSDSDLKDFAGSYPTAVFDVSKEFDATIPLDEKYNKPEIVSVKAATRKFDNEDAKKVYVDLRFIVTYKNGASDFCPLRYSWAKGTRVVLLEGEGKCERSGDPVVAEQAEVSSDPPQKAQEIAAPVKKEVQADANSETATASVEVTFLTDNPSAEMKEVNFLKNTDSYGEVEVKFKKTEGGKTLNCSNIYGYEYEEDRTFLLEVNDCK